MNVTKHYLKREKKESTPQCAVCLSHNIQILIDFGLQPNTFAMLKEPIPNPYLHNLTLSYCLDCGFVFQADPIPPEKIYSNYLWPSSKYPAEHLEWLAGEIVDKLRHGSDDIVLDVGSNDGYLLDLVRKAGHPNVLGVEPAQDCADLANKRGIKTINTYMNPDSAEDIRVNYALPGLIVCRHVMEHIQDVDLFLESIRSLMDDRTILILELPSFDVIAQKGDFCSVWEQHVNFFSTSTITKLLNRHGLVVMTEYLFPFAGGSMLHYVRRGEGENNPENAAILALKFRDKVRENIARTRNTIQRLHDAGNKIVAYGAGARGSCFINLAKIGSFLDYVIDDNPQKMGLYLPGSNLSVVGSNRLYEDIPGYCVVIFNSKENETHVMELHRRYVEIGGCFIEVFPGDFRNAPIISEVN